MPQPNHYDTTGRTAEHEAEMADYAAAIVACDATLQRAPDDIAAYDNKAAALLTQADLQADWSEYEAALASYTAAVALLDRLDRATLAKAARGELLANGTAM